MKILKKIIITLLIIVGVIFYITWLFDYPLVINIQWSDVLMTAREWQELLGSFIGVIAALSVVVFTQHRQSKQKNKEHLLFLQKNLVSAINNLSGIDKMLHRFINIQLRKYEEKVVADNNIGRYSVGEAFIPFTHAFTFEKEILKETTGSSYLENLILDVTNTSQDLPLMLRDLERQFSRTLGMASQVATLNLNSPAVHNESLLSNLKDFKEFIELYFFKVNIPVYARKIILTEVAVKKMSELGIKKWKKIFNFKFSPEASKKMSEYFKDDVNKAIQEAQKFFPSKLLLADEEVPGV